MSPSKLSCKFVVTVYWFFYHVWLGLKTVFLEGAVPYMAGSKSNLLDTNVPTVGSNKRFTFHFRSMVRTVRFHFCKIQRKYDS